MDFRVGSNDSQCDNTKRKSDVATTITEFILRTAL